MASPIFANFRYSVDDEPNEEWTIEELFQWSLLQSHKVMDDELENAKKRLKEQQLSAEEEIIQAFQQASQYLSNQENNPKKKKAEMEVQVLTGPHEGSSFKLSLSAKSNCLVGRSRNKTFRTKGVSLFEDLEVSTTHGKFALNDEGEICFIDLESTNGTTIIVSKDDHVRLEPDIPFVLSTGTKINCGASLMEVTIL